MLMNMKELLAVANEHNFAIPAFNIGTGQMLTGIIAECEAQKSPVILAIHPLELKFQGDAFIQQVIKAANDTKIPCVIHLDHSGLKYNLSSDCALLINADTGKVLYSKNENLRHANASTTKIMTCILALDNSSLNDKVTFSKKAAAVEPSKLYAKAGETFYMRDLLYSLMVPSHNDTAIAIAEHISGSTSAFAELMNEKARELGCTNTHFVTPNGLDTGLNHYTTASDLAIIARYAIKNPTFRKLINTKRYSLKSLNTKRNFTVATTNALLGKQAGVIGLKTGVTDKAGYCFVGLCRSRKGNTYISVTLGGPTSAARWRDSKILLTYAYKKG